MEEFWRNTVDQAQAYGPQLIKAALVMIAFIIGAFIVRWLIAAAIDRTGLAKKANASTTTSDSKSLGTSLAEAAFWVTILIGLMQALAIAGATQISSALHGVIDPILAYLPNVIGAALIFLGAALGIAKAKARKKTRSGRTATTRTCSTASPTTFARRRSGGSARTGAKWSRPATPSARWERPDLGGVAAMRPRGAARRGPPIASGDG